MDWSKLHKLVEAINTYYAFAVLMYVVVLYVSGHSQLFFWLFIALTPLLTAWSGYLLNSYLGLRQQRHGFKMVSNVMTYEILGNNRYILRYALTLKAIADHLISYPIGYQWTGDGSESLPTITGEGQQLIGVIRQYDPETATAKVGPYQEILPYEREWHYWLVGLNPPVNHGETVEIKYHQAFHDKKKVAKPSLYYMVKNPMKRLELSVKFPVDDLPKHVSGSYIKPSDPRVSHRTEGVRYEPDKQWATWVIEKPRTGYTYRIDWK